MIRALEGHGSMEVPMRTVCCLGLMLLLAPPLSAQWTEHTTTWGSQGLGASSGFVADPATDTVYYLFGLTVKTYDPSLDLWTDLNPIVGSGAVGYGNYERAFWTDTGQAGRIVTFYDHDQVDVYDVGTNIWFRNPLPLGAYDFSWGQGAMHDPSSGEVWVFWTDNVGDTYDLLGAPYDPATDTWGAVEELRFPQDYYWGRMKSVVVGTVDYSMDDNSGFVGQSVRMREYHVTQTPTFPIEEPVEYTQVYDLGSGRALAAGPLGLGTAFNTQTMAVIDDRVYVSGVQESDVMLMYDTRADTWVELPPRPNDDPTGTGRDHATVAAGGTVFVRDGSQFWTFEARIFADGFESGSMAAWSGPDPS
jgi:hypothetical protein